MREPTYWLTCDKCGAQSLAGDEQGMWSTWRRPEVCAPLAGVPEQFDICGVCSIALVKEFLGYVDVDPRSVFTPAT